MKDGKSDRSWPFLIREVYRELEGYKVILRYKVIKKASNIEKYSDNRF